MAESTIQHDFDLAISHHQAGRLREAERLYRRILAAHPQHSQAMHCLGVLAHQMGHNDVAIDLIRRALLLNPNDADCHYNLGNLLKDKGQFADAMAEYRWAIALRPSDADAHANLGILLADSGQTNEAIVAYHRAIALNPRLPQPYNNLGNVLKDIGKLDDALAAYDRAIALKRDYAEAYNNRGVALREKGDIDEAIAAYRQAFALKPDYAQAYSNLGNALRAKGQLDEAIAAHRQAIALSPNSAEFHCNLAVALIDNAQLDEAIVAARQAVALTPSLPEAHNNLGIALKGQDQPDAAVLAYRQAIALRPNYAEAHGNLGNVLKMQGQLDAAVAAFRQAIALKPDSVDAHGQLILALQYHPDFDDRAIAEELARWNRRHAEPRRKVIRPHSNDRDPERGLRIGYVSPDFRNHVVGRNVMPLFQHHDRRQFHITCYAQMLHPDSMTGVFQQNADEWRNIVGLSDEQVAEQIREDGIDILIDLALHTIGNRLPVFALKPAPVQVTFAGYPGSTGLTTIDYRLSDPFLDPRGTDETVYSERTLRLPDSFWCYDPMEGRDIPVNPLPALERGFITFGCLNNFCKINGNVLTLWAQVLRQVEKSRLLMLAPRGSCRQRALDQLSREGIDPERVEFVPFQSREGFLQIYHRIDLGLDSFPYNGHSTSLDSLWMGVPVITSVGRRAVSRAGWGQLSNLGLTELAAQTPQDFVSSAVCLAGDLPRLSQLRSTLRQRMEQSPLMDAPKFARSIEAAYRQMWKVWCATEPKSG
jgi:protein O-GlcNAc transferase